MQVSASLLVMGRVTALALCLIALGIALFRTPLAAQEGIDYAKAIDPIFQSRCVACHNHINRQGGFNVESYGSLVNGGKRGAPFVPGKSAESLVVKLLEGTMQPQMPPGDALSSDEIKTIKAWIDAGARGPNGATPPESTAKPEEPAKPATTTGNSKIPDIKPTVPVKASVTALAFQPGGELIALGRYKEVELSVIPELSAAYVAEQQQKKRETKEGSLPITVHVPAPSIFKGAINQVRAVAFSPDGKLLAAAGGNPSQFGEVQLWDVEKETGLRTWRGHRDNIFSIAFNPDGKLLATCSYDKLVKLWDVETGKEFKNLKDHTDAVFAVAFSPDGKFLASASADRTVKIWDVATGIRLYTLGDSLDVVNAISFHPSGKLIAGAGADRTIRIWQLGATEGKQIKSSIAHEDTITQIAYSPDGKLLATTGTDKALKLWNPETLTELHVLERQPDWVFALRFSPDGRRLAVGRYDGSVAFYDPATGK